MMKPGRLVKPVLANPKNFFDSCHKALDVLPTLVLTVSRKSEGLEQKEKTDGQSLQTEVQTGQH